MVRSYLSHRKVIYDTAGRPCTEKTTAGASLGSILHRPGLWNVSYDVILRMDLSQGAYLIGYADDIAVVILARDEVDAQRKLNQVIRRVIR